MANALTDDKFTTEVSDFEGVVLVDFWADWCGPCHAIAPTIEELSTDYRDNNKVKIMKLNVDENQQTAQKFNVMSIPTLLIFKNGEPHSQLVGVQPKTSIKDKLEAALSS